MRALILASALLPAIAMPAPYVQTLTGDQFVSMMNRPQPLSAADYMAREKAYSYLNGARDSTEGRVWCDVNTLKTPDLADDMAARLAKLPATERRKNAAVLLLDQLRRAHPCPQARGQS